LTVYTVNDCIQGSEKLFWLEQVFHNLPLHCVPFEQEHINHLVSISIIDFNWQFLSKDEGETELETTGEGWVEDEGTFIKGIICSFLLLL
jgi:hypothetical protein